VADEQDQNIVARPSTARYRVKGPDYVVSYRTPSDHSGRTRRVFGKKNHGAVRDRTAFYHGTPKGARLREESVGEARLSARAGNDEHMRSRWLLAR
jgi:hypothetical protein